MPSDIIREKIGDHRPQAAEPGGTKTFEGLQIPYATKRLIEQGEAKGRRSEAIMEAEQSIIGAILVNPTCLEHVQKDLTVDDFSRKDHRIIIKAFFRLAERDEHIDLKTLIGEIEEQGELKPGSKEYIASFVDVFSTSAGLSYHIKKVKTAAVSTKLYDLLIKSQDAIKGKVSFDEITSQIEAGIDEIRHRYFSENGKYTSAKSLLEKDFRNKAEVIGRGVLPDGGGLILAGESGAGKSLLRTELAIRLVMGWDIFEIPVKTSQRVLIIQFENPEGTEQYRLKKMLQGLNIKDFPNKLMFSDPTIRLDLSLKKDRPKAFELVKKSGAAVVIWDPLSSLHSSNENDNLQMRNVLDSITQINRKTGTSSIVIHHFGKPQEGQELQHRTRGATSIKDWADSLIAITKKPHNKKVLRYLTFLKVRNGPEHVPILIERDREYFTHSVTEEDIPGNPARIAEILESLGGEVGSQGVLVQAIVEQLDCSERTAKGYIRNAVEKTISEYGLGNWKKAYQLSKNSAS